MNSKEIASQQILFMAQVEDICEKQGLVPPVEVNVVDADGNQYDFEFRPEDDGVDLPLPCPSCCPSCSLSLMRRTREWKGVYPTLHRRQIGTNCSCNETKFHQMDIWAAHADFERLSVRRSPVD